MPSDDDGGAAVEPLDGAGDQLALLGRVLVEDGCRDSASRIFWIITCLAVWAAMRPSVSGSIVVLAVLGGDVAGGAVDVDETPAVVLLDVPKCRSAASWMADSMPSKMTSGRSSSPRASRRRA